MEIVLAKWLDAKVFIDPDGKCELPIMTSVGFLIDKNKKRLLLANLLAPDSDARVLTAIPMVLVQSIKKLK